MLSSHLKQRLLVGTLSFLFVSGSVFFSDRIGFIPVFVLLNILFIGAALSEYYRLGEQKGFRPLRIPGIAYSSAYIAAVAFALFDSRLDYLPESVLLFSLIFLFIDFFRRPESPLVNIALTGFGLLYLTIPLSCALRINYFFPFEGSQDGRIWLIYILAVTKSTDVGGYFIGKWKGKTPLAPIISPKKTIEGALAGLLLSSLVSILFALFFMIGQKTALFSLSLFQSIWIGLFVGVLAQTGDLTESLLKRDAGVKDSSKLPGLGGVLDIADSLVFTLPFMYLLLKMNLAG